MKYNEEGLKTNVQPRKMDNNEEGFKTNAQPRKMDNIINQLDDQARELWDIARALNHRIVSDNGGEPEGAAALINANIEMSFIDRLSQIATLNARTLSEFNKLFDSL